MEKERQTDNVMCISFSLFEGGEGAISIYVYIYFEFVCFEWRQTSLAQKEWVFCFLLLTPKYNEIVSRQKEKILNQYTFHYEFETYSFYDMACHFGGSKYKSNTLFDKYVCLTVVSIQHPTCKCFTLMSMND